ncbi:MAG TPA: histidine phosphatase family protein [Candidatus Limnocylindrales bacterium]|jgi:phosphohistidine phosphatase|nr:histidine phosphatase family protein [Candidatus Limnocylindrales bacterium]
MLLHLLRHADAGDPQAWEGPDAARPLSDKGRSQSERLGKYLAGIAFKGGLFISSPKVRAVETAELVAETLKAKVDLDDRLGEALGLDAVEAILHDAGDPERAVLIGHDPDFSDLLAELVETSRVPMRKGALARIEVDRPLRPGGGTLRWLIPPDALKPQR